MQVEVLLVACILTIYAVAFPFSFHFLLFFSFLLVITLILNQ